MPVQPYRLNSFGDSFDSAYERFGRIYDDATSRRAGNALRDGDYGGARDEFYGAGMLDQGLALEDRQAAQANARVQAEKQAEAEAAKFAADAASRLRQLYDNAPPEQKGSRLMAGFAQVAQRFRDLGETDDEIEGLRKQLETDPETTLTMLGATAAKEAGYEIVKGSDGSYVAVDKTTGRPAYKFNPPRQVSVPEGGALYEIPGSEGGGPASPEPEAVAQPPAPPDVRTMALAAVDDIMRAGGRVTSGRRTPERNREVGGVPNSRHLTDNARDLVPPPGMSMADFERRVRASMPEGTRVINERDHIHVQWGGGQKPSQVASAATGVAGGGGGGGGARLIVQRPKAAPRTTRPATAAEKAAYGIPADVPAQLKPDGSIDVISGVGANLKRVPAQVQSGYVDNRKSIGQIDAAIAALRKRPQSMGLRNKIGDDVMQRLDPDGVDVRASVSNIGSLLIHDRSGAAVTAAEQPRLRPFVPKVDDTAEAAIKKLRLLREQYVANNTEIETVFGEDAGYAPMGGSPKLKANPAAIRDAQIAIRRGADPAKVRERLIDNGIDPEGL